MKIAIIKWKPHVVDSKLGHIKKYESFSLLLLLSIIYVKDMLKLWNFNALFCLKIIIKIIILSTLSRAVDHLSHSLSHENKIYCACAFVTFLFFILFYLFIFNSSQREWEKSFVNNFSTYLSRFQYMFVCAVCLLGLLAI
jgi:hypothetical protein